MAIFLALDAGAEAGFSPPPQPAATHAARMRTTGNLERRQVMGRCSLRMLA
jgi:hypothetical protein